MNQLIALDMNAQLPKRSVSVLIIKMIANAYLMSTFFARQISIALCVLNCLILHNNILWQVLLSFYRRETEAQKGQTKR